MTDESDVTGSGTPPQSGTIRDDGDTLETIMDVQARTNRGIIALSRQVERLEAYLYMAVGILATGIYFVLHILIKAPWHS